MALLFVALALVWSFPLAAHLSTHLPGEGIGDNAAFLWNTAWMRQALASSDVHFFHTDRLFAPFGADLVLNTHTALPSLIAATVFGSLPVVAAQNAVVLLALALNGFSAFLLALDRTRHRGAAILAGAIFAGSPYIATHLLGHFNLIGAWGIPLFLLWLLRAFERDSVRSAAAAGLCLVAVAYTDYYYLIYCGVLGLGLTLSYFGVAEVSVRRSVIRPAVSVIVAALLALDLLLLAAVLLTGGFDRTVLGVRVVARGPGNLPTFAWLVILGWLAARYRPAVRWRAVDPSRLQRRARVVACAGAVALLGGLPLALHAWTLWRAGGYVAPHPFWRSNPAGIDVATFVLGNPQHPIWGGWVRTALEMMHINRVENAGWIGVAPLALVWWAMRRHRDVAEIRRWALIGAVFLVWALGPWLRVAGVDTGVLLPQNFFAYVPVLSNARIPGRALVVVFLAVSLICAQAVALMRSDRQRAALFALAVLIGIDYLPAPFPVTAVQVSPIYTALRAMSPNSIVCELPAGYRDGFGVVGRFDDQTLINQMEHRHPIVGGFIARIPPAIVAGYAAMPVLRSLIQLSSDRAADPLDLGLTRADATQALRRQGIHYVVLNRDEAPARLIDYVEASIGLMLLQKERGRELYQVSEDGRSSVAPSR